MVRPRKDHARWDILDGPPAFNKSCLQTTVTFSVFDQRTGEAVQLQITITDLSRERGTSWNRFFLGTAHLGKQDVSITGVYRPGHHREKGYIVES